MNKHPNNVTDIKHNEYCSFSKPVLFFESMSSVLKAIRKLSANIESNYSHTEAYHAEVHKQVSV